MTHSIFPTTFAACALLLAFGRSSALTLQRPGAKIETPPIEAPSIALVTWKELSEHPGRWVGRRVRLHIQFQSHVASWNPYLTRFGTGQFRAIQAWADEQFPWELAEFEAPAVRLFLRKESACEWAFAEAPAYARYEVLAVVREAFLDEPWLEVQQVVPLEAQISEGTLIHASRAENLMQAKSWKLAWLELERALAGRVPALARAELERLRGVCEEEERSVRPPMRDEKHR